MKVSRTYARFGIIALTVGLLMLMIGGYLKSMIYIYISIVSISTALIIKYFILKCPYCGWGGAPPQWSKSGTIHCPKCGKLLEYDK